MWTDIRTRIRRYCATPLIGRGALRDYAPTLTATVVGVVVAILLVHAFSPGGLNAGELVVHVITLTVGFGAGLFIAGAVVLNALRWASVQTGVGHLWLISVAGFAAGLLVLGLIENLPVIQDVAARASAAHGPIALFPRLLPVWAILTAFVAHAEMLRSYEAIFEAHAEQFQQSDRPSEWNDTVRFESGKKRYAFRLANIVRVNAEENYCAVHTVNDGGAESHLLRTTFGSVVEALPPSVFLQVHRSHVVNRFHVDKLKRRGRQLWIEMTQSGSDVPVSRRRLSDVLARLDT